MRIYRYIGSVLLEYPAYSTATHQITLRDPEIFNTDAMSGKLKTMLMSDGGFRTYTQSIRGRFFDMTFNLYCKKQTVGDTYSGMVEAVEFFLVYNGNYIKFTDAADPPRTWIMQILDKDIEMDHVSRNHWQFSLTGLRFPVAETGSGGKQWFPAQGLTY